jgi:hypothetical protein
MVPAQEPEGTITGHGSGKEPQLGQRHRARLLGKATAVRRLPAAGLVGREMHLDSFALEQADGVHARLRAEHVDQAGPEEVDPGRLVRVVAAACSSMACLLCLTLAESGKTTFRVH